MRLAVPSLPLTRMAAGLLAALFTLWLLHTLVAPAAAQEPPTPSARPTLAPTASHRLSPTPVPGLPSPVPSLPFDPFAFLQEQVQRTLAELLASTLQPLRDALRDHLDRQFNVFTVTRLEHSAGLPQVQQLHAVARAIANGAVALLLMVGGYNLIFRRHLTGDDAELWPIIGRLLLAALAANTALMGGGSAPQGWIVWFIALNNALIDATGRVLPISIAGLFAAGPLDPLVIATWPARGPGPLLALLMLAVLLLVFLLWLLQMLMRLALLALLLSLAPLAVILWALPQTEGWARLWWRIFLPALFCQFLQVAALGLATALGRALGAPGEAALAPLVGIATLVLVLKLPGLLAAGLVGSQTISGSVRGSLALVALARRAVARG